MADWSHIIGNLKHTEAFVHANNYQLQRRNSGAVVFPPKDDVFNAFKYTPLDKLKVVILGQDPYPGVGQAMGLAFSVHTKIPVPRSLVNIYKELATDIPGFQIPDHGNLIPWARQGVLLLNACLTVEEGKPLSHQKIGWEQFTDGVIKAINDKCENLVFMLWGNPAQQKGACIDANKHLVLKCAHPSPLSASRGFFGCHHFSKANKYLIEHHKKPIDWQLPLHLDGDEQL